MSEVIHIYRAVTHRCCPSCGYLVAQFMIEQARLDFDCPRCGKHKQSEFQPIQMNQERRQGDEGE